MTDDNDDYANLDKLDAQVIFQQFLNAPVDDSVYLFLDKKRSEGKHYYVYMTAGANKLRFYVVCK